MTALPTLRYGAQILGVGAVTVLALTGLTGCGSAGTSAAASNGSAAASGPGGSGGSGGSGGFGGFPGAAGLIAAVQGDTLQVQGNSQQTAVTYSSTTRITKQTPTTASALSVGACVMARPARPASGTGSPTPVAPSPTSSTSSGAGQSISVAGGTVQIMPAGAAGGSGCSFGGRSGRPSTAPTTDAGAAQAGGQGRPGMGGFGAVGNVASIGASSFTVTPMGPGGSSGDNSGPVMVSYDGTTRFLTTAPGKAADVTIGECVRAMGKADDTGAISATSLALSPAVDGACSFGGRGSGRMGSNAAGSTNG